MDIKFEYMSAAQMRVLATAMIEIADIEERERAQRDAEFADLMPPRRSRPAGDDIDPGSAPLAPLVPQEPAAEEKQAKKPRAKKEDPAPTPTASEEAPPAAPAPAPASPSKPGVTLEEVRAKLASLSQAGKAPQVKDLLKQFGATKLTDVAAEKFADLITAAEGL